MTQPTLFDLPDEPANMPRIVANPGNRPYGKGRPCTPAAPGSGPAGEACGGCFLARRFNNGNGKSWIKCHAMRQNWTGGTGTDIKAKWPACARWYPKDKSLMEQWVTVCGHAAIVYRHKGESPPGWTGKPPNSLGDLWVWWDWMLESGWRPLLPPGYRDNQNQWQVVTA